MTVRATVLHDIPLMSWKMFSLLCPGPAWDYVLQRCLPGQTVETFVGPAEYDSFYLWDGKIGALFTRGACIPMEFEYVDGEWEEI